MVLGFFSRIGKAASPSVFWCVCCCIFFFVTFVLIILLVSSCAVRRIALFGFWLRRWQEGTREAGGGRGAGVAVTFILCPLLCTLLATRYPTKVRCPYVSGDLEGPLSRFGSTSSVVDFQVGFYFLLCNLFFSFPFPATEKNRFLDCC